MSAATVFLVVMIIGLALGNALFFLVKKRRRAGQAKAGVAAMDGGVQVSNGQFGGESQGLQQAMVSTAPMAQKIELAHARLQALESRVKSMQGIYGETLRAKVDKLESFRDTANAEIIAVKEILEGMQRKSTSTGNGRNVGPALEKGISAEEMRRLIYNRSQT